ncbi:hypothetical protein FRB90_003815 [Tulasnella sp. 427]|nr:hypothetical protein FRB90_003815 [Tulasnella sp. 427]
MALKHDVTHRRRTSRGYSARFSDDEDVFNPPEEDSFVTALSSQPGPSKPRPLSQSLDKKKVKSTRSDREREQTPDLVFEAKKKKPQTWEQVQFYQAVKLHQRNDPWEEYVEREKRIALAEAQDRVSRQWQPIAELLQMPLPGIAPSASATHIAPPAPVGLEATFEEAADEQARELAIIFQELEWNDERKAETARHEDKNRAMSRLRADIEATCRAEEARLAKIEEERQRVIRQEKARADEEARKKAEAEARLKAQREEEKRMAEEATRKQDEERKRKEEEDKRRVEEQKEKERARIAEEQARLKKEEEEQQEADRSAGLKPQSAKQEWTNARDQLKKLKKEIMPLVRGNKGDDSMRNSEWRKVWIAAKRFFTPKIGQVTNSQSAIDRIATEIHGKLSPLPTEAYPQQLYLALLSSLAKAFLLQAETEITAKKDTAFPLARLVLKIIDLGHPMLADAFMARMVGRTGGWSLGAVVTREPGQSDEEFRKAHGHNPNDNAQDFMNRLVGIITLYAAILQTPLGASRPVFGQAPQPPPFPPYCFQLPRLWTLLARIASTPALIHDRSASLVLVALINTAGDRLMQVYGKQVVKLVKTIGARCHQDGPVGVNEDMLVGGKAGKEGRPDRARLGLLLEKWMKEGKVGDPSGRDVGP